MSFDRVVGIDPGSSGAAVVLWNNHNIDISPFKGLLYVDQSAMLRQNVGYGRIKGYLEAVHNMPGDGGSTLFKFARNYMFAESYFLHNQLPYELIDPKRWQLYFGLGGKQGPIGCTDSQEKTARKNAHKRKAQELFPNVKVTLDIADAMLIAEYGWRKTFGGFDETVWINSLSTASVGCIFCRNGLLCRKHA